MKKSTLIALSAAAVLAACGGSDYQNTPPATSQVPASASESVDGFIAYLKLLVATMTSETDLLEPVDTATVTPPTDDVGDPQVVD